MMKKDELKILAGKLESDLKAMEAQLYLEAKDAAARLKLFTAATFVIGFVSGFVLRWIL